MCALSYVKPTPISLKRHPEFNEKWLQDRIIDDPSILGLGDLEVKDIEKKQPKAGRLDLLLRDSETGKRYEVEIMLGTVDESHIIRTIEYWDIERKRYPQYDHCAVIVAENITARFLNVIGLFNSAIPLIAIQLNAFQVGESIVLSFTTVLDEIVLGEDDDEESDVEVVDREYWINKGSQKSLANVDECLSILKEIKPTLNLQYKRYYIGLAEDGQTNNFVIFRAKKQFLRVEVRINDQDDWTKRLDEAGMVVLQGDKHRKRIVLRITGEDLSKNRMLICELFGVAYKEQSD